MVRAKHTPVTRNGRPVKLIDWEEVDEALRAGCKGTEIAASFDMHPNTFYERVVLEKGVSFTNYSREKAEEGNKELRKAQFNCAVKEKNITMQIWLGKHRLGQSEKDFKKELEMKQKLLEFEIEARKKLDYHKSLSPNDDQVTQLLEMIKENQKMREEIEKLKDQIQNGPKPEADPGIQSGDKTL